MRKLGIAAALALVGAVHAGGTLNGGFGGPLVFGNRGSRNASRIAGAAPSNVMGVLGWAVGAGRWALLLQHVFQK